MSNKATKAARADNTTTSASPQSHLAALQGAVATVSPQGATALFVRADVQGKEHAQAYRLHVISTAVLELLKGNPRNLREAMELVAQLGKGKKARAYAAGFAVLADVAPLARTGKWLDAQNAELRTQADTLTAAYVAQFASAHATVMAEKPTPKAKKEVPAPAPAPVETAAPVDTIIVETEQVGSLAVGDVIASAIEAIKQGLAEPGELEALRAALAAYDTPAVPAELLMPAHSTAPAHAH
jgi:hypothetical protein